MEEDETGGVDPLDPGQSSASSGLGPVQEVPEDLSVKREAVASSSSVSPPHNAAGFKTNVSRSSSSPSSEGELLFFQSYREALWLKSCLSTGYRWLFWDYVGKFP